jgi:hypothetical protein
MVDMETARRGWQRSLTVSVTDKQIKSRFVAN